MARWISRWSLLSLTLVLGLSVAMTVAQSPSPPVGGMYLNVRDFGAVGDGVADDTEAIQRAIRAAGQPDPARPGTNYPTGVYLPRGIYRITRTLEITPDAAMAHFMGAGTYNSRRQPQTSLKWDGPQGGTLLNLLGYMGLRLSDMYLDGSDRAGVMVRLNSLPGFGMGNIAFERLVVTHGDLGFELGKDLDSCAGDMTFVDCWMEHCKSAGFRACQPQQVDYVFIRCGVIHTPIGFHFPKGGNAHWILPCFGRVFTAIKIEAGGINCGVFTITGLQQETFSYDNEKKRFTTLDAQGEVNVSISGIYTGCGNVWGETADLETPNLILGPSAQVTVRDSMLSGKIAVLRGRAGALATWLQFDNCRFRCAADPRKDITTDAYSGYELRNCHVVKDDTLSAEYKVLESVMIPHLAKYPKRIKMDPSP